MMIVNEIQIRKNKILKSIIHGIGFGINGILDEMAYVIICDYFKYFQVNFTDEPYMVFIPAM